MEQHALNPGVNVYQGLWIDWTKGGCTLTLGPTSAAVLTNSLTVFVTICGIQLWMVIRYTLHRRGTSDPPAANTPHLSKEQLILRNASSALETAYLLLGLARISRKSSGQRSRRTYSIAVWAIIYAILFLVATAFSSQAITGASTNNGSAVLLQNDQCSVWNQSLTDIIQLVDLTSLEDFAMYDEFMARKAHDFQISLAYARDCYMSEVPTIDMSYTCHTFKKPRLGLQPILAGKCPFEPQMCMDNVDAVVLDTGLISSSEDFGINAASHDRLTYRSVTTCAVLNSTAYIKNSNTTQTNSSNATAASTIAQAYYGPSIRERTDWTYSFSDVAAAYNNFTAFTRNPYQLDVELAYAPSDPQWSVSDFEPIPELRQKNADVSLLFLSFTGMYLEPVDDPWFAARQLYQFNRSLPFLQKRFAPDQTISTIACAEQHNFCLSDGTCTGLHGFDQVQNNPSFNAYLTPIQNATFDRILRAVAVSRLSNVVQFLASAPLLANNLIITGKSGAVLSQGLPSHQWKTELQYWHAYSMAQLQRTLVQLASGQFYPTGSWTVPATLPQDIWFCRSLIIPSVFYRSFDVVAMSIIITCGVLVLLLSAFIEQLTDLVRRKCLKQPSSQRYWDHDNVLEQGMKRIDDNNEKLRKWSWRSSSTRTNSERTTLKPCPGHWQSQLNFSRGIMLHIPDKGTCRFCESSKDNRKHSLDKI